MKKIERMCMRTMQRAARVGVRLAAGLAGTAGAAAACTGVRFPDAAVEATVIVGAAVSLGWALRGWRE